MTQPVIFISYSRKDEKEKDRLLSHLRVLQRQGSIALWSDDRISGGDDWKREISEAMAQARVAILLISVNFLTSDFVLREEVPTLLKRRKSEGLTIFPIIAKACAWKQVEWLTEINVRPKNGRPIWGSRGRVDHDLTEIAQEIAEIIKTGPHTSVQHEPVQPTSGISEAVKVAGSASERGEIKPSLTPQIETGSVEPPKPGVNEAVKVAGSASEQVEIKPPFTPQIETGSVEPPKPGIIKVKKPDENVAHNPKLWVFGVIIAVSIITWLFYTFYIPSNVRIAFESSQGLHWNIYILESNKLNRKTTGLATNVDPTWSPAGSKLAFASDRNGNMDIYTQDADGKETALTTHPASDIEPAYSLPFGSKLAFASNRSGNWDIYTLDSNKEVEQMTRDPASDREPAFSPNGSKLVFISDRDGDWEIYTLDPNREVEQMTRDPASDREPAFSPDGTKLAFASNRHGNWEIYVLDADRKVTRLTNNQFEDRNPVWSPDGTQIAFHSSRDGNREIYMMNADGSDQTNLTNSPDTDDRNPSWALKY